MKKIIFITAMIITAISTGVAIFSYRDSVQKTKILDEYKILMTSKPSVSISRLRVDSVDEKGNVYGVEYHAGESGSSDGCNSKIVLPPNSESKYWARYPYQVPEEEVYILRVETWGKQGQSWTEVITPSW